MSQESNFGSFPPVPDAAGPPPAAPTPPAHVPDDRFDAPPSEPQPHFEFDWRKNLALFLATVASVFFVGQIWTAREGMSPWQALLSAWQFAVPLLVILVCHELGHYIAARIHRVPASLPYFIPLPIFSPFGTMGAVILMPERIRSRRALLDIGAAGPLAGMFVAIPIMLYGLSLSHVIEKSAFGYLQEGESLLYWACKALVLGPIDSVHDIETHPVALAAWVGFLVTFLNLLPVGQFDGGHVAFALLGDRQKRLGRWFVHVPLVMLLFNLLWFGLPVLRHYREGTLAALGPEPYITVKSAATNWVVPYLLVLLVRSRGGGDHPPVDDLEMGRGRKVVAWGTLLLFLLLFMPSPFVAH